jgi:hypothetical protein
MILGNYQNDLEYTYFLDNSAHSSHLASSSCQVAYHAAMRSLKFLLLPLLIASLSPVMAADLPAVSRLEIETLLNRLGSSGCQFNRNGSWYNSVDAKAHLTKKLNYLIDKKKVEGTEQFISLAASSSSMSGKDYLVRCGSAQPVASEAWLKHELQAIRSKPAMAPASAK